MVRGLANPAGEFLADGLDDLPLPGDDLERLGDVFTHLHDPVRPAAGAGGGRFDDPALARQMVRERFARRAAAFEAGAGRDLRYVLGSNLVFGGGRLELFEL